MPDTGNPEVVKNGALKRTIYDSTHPGAGII
jgi:hypothetical protein